MVLKARTGNPTILCGYFHAAGLGIKGVLRRSSGVSNELL
jgi:hypothetical protein